MPAKTPNETTSPIRLDRRASWIPEAYRRHLTLSEIICQLLVASLGLLIGWYLILLTQRGEIRDVLVFVASLPLLWMIQLSIHEFGHLLAAFLVGFRIDRLKLGPLLLTTGMQKPHVHFDWSLGQPAGYVTAMPASSRIARMRTFFFVAAGPLASLSAGVLSLQIASSINESTGTVSPNPLGIQSPSPTWLFPKNLAAACFAASGVLAFAYGVPALVPVRHTGSSSDGAKLIDLFLRKDQTERNAVLSMLAIQMSQGTRPRDWEQAFVNRLLRARTDAPDNAPTNLFAYYWALDCGKIQEAREFLQLALAQFEGYPIDSRAALFLEGAYFTARYEDDVPAAFGWLAESREGYAEEQTRCRAEAALLLARGQFAEAKSQAKAGLKAIPNSKDLGGRMAEKEWLEDLLRQCPAN